MPPRRDCPLPRPLPVLLKHLSARPVLLPRDADQAAVSFDRVACVLWISRLHLYLPDALRCTLAQVKNGRPTGELAAVDVRADRGLWQAHACTIAGQAVPANPRDVLTLMEIARLEITRSIPLASFEEMLLDYTGLRLPLAS